MISLDLGVEATVETATAATTHHVHVLAIPTPIYGIPIFINALIPSWQAWLNTMIITLIIVQNSTTTYVLVYYMWEKHSK